jgi:hypothetical protein
VSKRAEHPDHTTEAVKERDAQAQTIPRREAQADAEPVPVVDDVPAGRPSEIRSYRTCTAC